MALFCTAAAPFLRTFTQSRRTPRSCNFSNSCRAMRDGIRLAGLATRKVLPEAAQPGRCAADPMVVEQLRISDLSVLAGAALSQRLPHLGRVLLHRQAKSEKFFKNNDL